MLKGKWTKENFAEYDAENPAIYDYFEKFSLIMAERVDHYSAKCVFHRVRWETTLEGKDDVFKIDDGWISHYARKFMELNPKYGSFFKLRTRKNSYHNGEKK